MIYIIAGVTSLLGKEIVKQLLKRDETFKIIGISRNEYVQWRMKIEINDPRLVFRTGDIRNDLTKIVNDEVVPEIVTQRTFINLASLKHVDLAEDNRNEYKSVIVDGTESFCKLALQSNGRTITMSSDKACYPSGVYGSSKLLQEKTVLDYNGVVVRTGNIIEAHGNIIEKLKRTNPTITCTGMTRFYIHASDLATHIINLIYKPSGIYAIKSKSAKLGDIVTALKPELITNETKKFRQGEKMHEHLITRNDYPVQETANWFYIGNNVTEAFKRGFEYASNDNKDWWTVEEIKGW
jgi:FlaA1/EpsC-like NDP-sugar epimerase